MHAVNDLDYILTGSALGPKVRAGGCAMALRRAGIGAAGFISALLIGLVVGWPARGNDGVYTRRPVVVASKAEKPDHLRCAGGQAQRFKVDLAPTLIRGSSQGEALDATVAFEHSLDADASLVYETELISDTGKPVGPSTRSPIISARPRAKTTPTSMTVSRLPDGYYVLRVTAAARSGADEASALGMLYLHYVGGRVEVLDVNEYHARSKANFAIEGGAR
jgi:hypothetical protein